MLGKIKGIQLIKTKYTTFNFILTFCCFCLGSKIPNGLVALPFVSVSFRHSVHRSECWAPFYSSRDAVVIASYDHKHASRNLNSHWLLRTIPYLSLIDSFVWICFWMEYLRRGISHHIFDVYKRSLFVLFCILFCDYVVSNSDDRCCSILLK